MSGDAFDFVIVGAGSTGCVVAARIAESGKHTVALLEAGGEADRFWMRVPLGWGKLYADPRCNWVYESEPEEELGGVRTVQPRGKVLGGTGTVNGMIYMRGQKEDFDHWRRLGNVGWSYAEVLPYFKRSESNERGPSEYHGANGPVGISDIPRHDLAEAFIGAAEQAGYPRNDDFNGVVQDGFGYNQLTTRNGQRSSTERAFLAPARRRPNLEVFTEATASRILFDGRAAVAVEYRRGGETHIVRARREVIVCCGVFNSPQLLQVSGIGSAGLLQASGIPVIADLPGVGDNLQDHFTASLNYRCSRPITLNDSFNNRWRRFAMGMQYLLFKKGLMATNATYAGGCIRTDPSLAAPDVKLHLQLWSRATGLRSKEAFGLHPFSAFGVSMNLMHPDSRGTVRIRSKRIEDPPRLYFGFLKSERDRTTSIKAIRAIRRIMAMPAIRHHVTDEFVPGASCASEGELLSFLREKGRSQHHATSSCKMGTDAAAVVDPRLRVHGVDRLRIADASIMPRIVAGSPYGVTIMIGEKGAAMILEDNTR